MVLNPETYAFFSNEKLNSEVIQILTEDKNYRPFSKESLALVFKDVMGHFDNYNLLYDWFRRLAREFRPETEQKIPFMEANNSPALADLNTSQVLSLAEEGLTTYEDFELVSEKGCPQTVRHRS